MAAANNDAVGIDIITNADSAADSTRHIFPFLTLPRELRNWIYGEAQEDVHLPLTTTAWSNFCPSIRCAICHSASVTNLLLVSRQVKLDYEEELARSPARLALDFDEIHALLKFKDRATLLANYFIRVKSLEIHFRPVDLLGFYGYCLEESRAFAQLLAMLRGLESLHVVCFDELEKFEDDLGYHYTVESFSSHNVRKHLTEILDSSSVEQLAIQISIRLHDPLFVLNDIARSTPTELQAARHYLNRITYHAVPSSDSSAWHGLDLQVDETATRSYSDAYEAAVHEQQRGYETMSFWSIGDRIGTSFKEVDSG